MRQQLDLFAFSKQLSANSQEGQKLLSDVAELSSDFNSRGRRFFDHVKDCEICSPCKNPMSGIGLCERGATLFDNFTKPKGGAR